MTILECSERSVNAIIFISIQLEEFSIKSPLKLRKTLSRYNSENSDFRWTGERSLEARMFSL